MRLVALSTAIFLAACGSAFAQAGGTQPDNDQAGNTGKNLDHSNSAQGTDGASQLPDQVKSELQQAGFSDVQVVPRSFLVQAKDKDGRPVMMLISENAIMAITGYRDDGAGTTGGGASPGADSPPETSGQGAGAGPNSGSGK